MLTADFITFATIFGGLALTLALHLFIALRTRTAMVPVDLFFSIFANSMTICTIGCIVWNLAVIVAGKNLSPSLLAGTSLAQTSVNVEGSEATAFFALTYALSMIAAAMRRTVMAACT